LAEMAGNVEDQIKSVENSNAVYLTATRLDLVRPMFQVSWQAVLASLTRPLQESHDLHVIQLCLEGLQHAIHIACNFAMEEATTFVESLAKFTLLSNLQEIKPRNIEAIKCLLTVGATEGNYLGDAWKEVLRCVSHLDVAQVLGASFEPGRKRLPDILSETASQALIVSADKIFESSRLLNGDAIVCFVRWLCQVSLEELKQSPPREYCLKKMVDVAHYNMERIRLEWSHIWAIMGDYFNKVGCMANVDVARFAVDSLRQLSIKFLDKGELANFSFQKDFLRPFEYIMSHNKAPAIREMGVQCVAQMVQKCAGNIRSGWKNIFFVFSLAASDNDQQIVDLAFSTTKLIFEEHFSEKNHHRATLIASSFMDAVNCLSEFACNSFFNDISMEAIHQLRQCATHVHKTPEFFVLPHEDDSSDEPMIWVRGWFPVLFGLSRIINRCKLDIRVRALQVMMDIMKEYGAGFLEQWWKDIFNVVFRIFDDKKLQQMESQQERDSWMSGTCSIALRSIVDVVSLHFDVLQDVLLPEVFTLLKWCISKDQEDLARTGTESLHILVMNNGNKFTEKSWQLTCEHLQSFFDVTTPRELLAFEADKTSTDTFEAIVIKCVVQLALIDTVDWIVLSSTEPDTATRASDVSQGGEGAGEGAGTSLSKETIVALREAAVARPVSKAGEMFAHLSTERLLSLLNCLVESNKFAHTFNQDKALRTALWKAGFLKKKNRSKPNLLKQEKNSLQCSLKIMFRIYEAEDRSEAHEAMEKQIMEVCTATLKRFVDAFTMEERRAWAPIICFIFQEILNLEDERFTLFAKAHYGIYSEMLVVGFDEKMGEIAFFLSKFFQRARAFVL